MTPFYDIYELLLDNGYSPQEALERLFVIFDWEVRGVGRVVDFREDEFADDEAARQEAAERGEDFTAMWLAARERNDGSHIFLEGLVGLSEYGLG